MDIGYKEKSVMGSMVLTVIVNVYYFYQAWLIFQAGAPTVADLLPLMIAVVVLMVVLEIIFEIFLAQRSEDAAIDERDKAFETSGDRYSAYVLAAGIYFSLGHIIINDAFEQLDSTTIFVAANIMILTLVVAEMTKGFVQLAAYRRSA